MKLYSVTAHSRPSILLKKSIAQPAFFALGGVRHESITKQWKGASTDDHTTQRSKRGDEYDIHSSASASGMEERRQSEGVADKTKSQGMTQRGGTESGKKAKADHPAAPEPVIGMNDERAQVSTDRDSSSWFEFMNADLISSRRRAIDCGKLSLVHTAEYAGNGAGFYFVV